MREQALAIIRAVTDPDQALNQLREYLQTLILRSFHESEAFRPLAVLKWVAIPLILILLMLHRPQGLFGFREININLRGFRGRATDKGLPITIGGTGDDAAAH